MIFSTLHMIITLFTFGISWAVYAFIFYGMTLVTPAFHSSYTQETFSIAFLIAFLDAAFLKAIRVMNFKIHPVLLFLMGWGINYMLIEGTSGFGDTYYVTGHKGPVIVATVMGCSMVLFEMGKEKFFSDVRL
jgi:hypothetical protein